MVQKKHDPNSGDNLLQGLTAAEKVTPRILIAEDDDEMRRLLTQELSAAGCEVIPCRNGMELIAHFESFILNEGSLDFDLIISDILMPGLTGLEVFEDLHNQRGFPPMILITAFGDHDIHENAKRLGAAAIFDKPFEMDDLMAEVHKILSRQRS